MYLNTILGGNVEQLNEEWEHERDQYSFICRNIHQECGTKIGKNGWKEFSKARWKSPFDENYHAELDNTDLCDAILASKYRSLIGSANWIVTLGRFDIAFATATLARYCMAPRMGHYQAAQSIFGYLKNFLMESCLLILRNVT